MDLQQGEDRMITKWIAISFIAAMICGSFYWAYHDYTRVRIALANGTCRCQTQHQTF